MLKHLVATGFVVVVCGLSPRTSQAAPQSGPAKDQKATKAAAPAPEDHDGWGRPVTAAPKSQKPLPAPRHDLSGTRDPGDGGIGQLGSKAMPGVRSPEHLLPYTPAADAAQSQY